MGGYWRETRGADDPGERIEQPVEPPPTDRPPSSWPNLEAASTEKLLQAMGYTWADRLSPQAGDLPRESQEAVERFDPRQANLPDLTRDEAGAYIRDNGETRPWLKPAERSAPEVQHVVAAIDQGGGHALDRHEGYATEERLERRVERLEDPAQLDPDLRAEGKDARKPDKLHTCDSTATAIADAKAFAAAFAAGTRHPDVRAWLLREREPYELTRPDPVEIPIEDLLGEHGADHCEGYRLLPVDGDIDAAKTQRRDWVRATPEDRSTLPSPQTEVIPSEDFRGGSIVFTFRVTTDFTHWEIASMYPLPRHRNES